MKKILFKKTIFGLFITLLLLMTTTANKAMAATGNLYIGDEYVGSLTENHSGTGWTWNAATETMTLTAAYTSGSIWFNYCAADDLIKVKVTENVTINGNIYCMANLSLDASGYTLNFVGETSLSNRIDCLEDCSITGGTFNIAESTGGSIAVNKNLNISGNTSITASKGFMSPNGSILINTTGTITVEGTNNVIRAYQTVTISSGSVFVNATSDTSIMGSAVFISGNANVTTVGCIYATNNVVDISTSGTVNVESSYIGIYAQTDMYISSGTINVNIITVSSMYPALYAYGTINVSGGTVTLIHLYNFFIVGTLVHTGGTINGQGPPTTPTVVTGEITNITYNSAIVHGNVTDNGGSDIINKKIMYRIGTTGAIYEKTASGSDDDFSAELTGLQANTLYNVRAAAENNEGWGYGEWVEFTTEEAPPATTIPSVVTESVNADETAATVIGSVSNNGGAEVTAYKVEYRKLGESIMEETATGDDSSFSAELTDLESGAMYQTRAAAQNSEGWGYGEWKSFSTTDLPMVLGVTVTPSSVSVERGATQQFTANVSATGGASTEVTWTVSGAANAATSINSSGLLSVAESETSETLTVTATSVFDTSKKGTASVTVVGELPPAELPTVITGIISVNGTSANVSGSVSYNGGDIISARKIEYRKSGEITILEKTASGNDASFSANLLGLEEETDYQARAAALNSTGWGYGDWKNFTITNTPSIISVEVIPASVSVTKGETYQFSAEVSAAGGANTAVIWSIEGHTYAGTTITDYGFLTVDLNEPASVISVIATSYFDNSKTGTSVVTLTPAGIDEWRDESGEWRIYPNPAFGKLRIENGELRIGGVEIYNLNGRIVKCVDNPSRDAIHCVSNEIDVSDLQHGMYFIKIKTEK
ncbi:fibronectin type III domain-containing protein, partial [Bacteroidales bacterium OttesenSCG-928-L14]|nr:fibronectin type III domain-containing protein [Bacteroidales bacterium OttesenSCG-928-L14]